MCERGAGACRAVLCSPSPSAAPWCPTPAARPREVPPVPYVTPGTQPLPGPRSAVSPCCRCCCCFPSRSTEYVPFPRPSCRGCEGCWGLLSSVTARWLWGCVVGIRSFKRTRLLKSQKVELSLPSSYRLFGFFPLSLPLPFLARFIRLSCILRY